MFVDDTLKERDQIVCGSILVFPVLIFHASVADNAVLSVHTGRRRRLRVLK